jgi:hypothetical protein
MFTRLFFAERIFRICCGGGASSVEVDRLLCSDSVESVMNEEVSDPRTPWRGGKSIVEEDAGEDDSVDGSDGREPRRSMFDGDALDARDENDGLDIDRPDGAGGWAGIGVAMGFGGGVGCMR